VDRKRERKDGKRDHVDRTGARRALCRKDQGKKGVSRRDEKDRVAPTCVGEKGDVDPPAVAQALHRKLNLSPK